MVTKKTLLTIAFGALLVSGLGVMQVSADDDEHEGRERGEREHEGFGGTSNLLTAPNATWQAECSACHIAYPPGMLPAASWQAIMGSLDKHFDTDASLDAKVVAEILPFLQQNAAPEKTPKNPDKPVLRITETAWFKGQHDEVSAIVWQRVKSPANCAACHTTADKGNFSEDNVRIPRKE